MSVGLLDLPIALAAIYDQSCNICFDHHQEGMPWQYSFSPKLSIPLDAILLGIECESISEEPFLRFIENLF